MPELDEKAYLQWKNWSKESFGQMRKGDFAYFDSELGSILRQCQVHRVLEIGFGEGTFLGFCKAKGFKVTGVELSQSLIAVAQSAGYEVVHSDNMQTLSAGEFDLVVAFDVIEHIEGDQILDFFRALAGLMSANGRILVRFPNADSWLGNVNQNGDITHVAAVGYQKLVYIAQQTGLQIEEFRAERRRGFASGLIFGLHMLVSEPLRRIIALGLRAVYFPKVPIVLTSSNVVAILKAR